MQAELVARRARVRRAPIAGLLAGLCALMLFAVSAAAPAPDDGPRGAAETLIRAWLAGPGAAVPPTCTLYAVTLAGDALTVQIDCPPEFLGAYNADVSETLMVQLRVLLIDLPVRRITVESRWPGGAFRPLASFLPQVSAPHKVEGTHEGLTGGAVLPAGYRPSGPLSGKTIYVSQGHGWLYQTGAWRTQRPVYQEFIEDFQNAEAVNWYLTQYLYQAGANVWTVRERDFNHAELIVDNDAGAPGYVESGLWTTSSFTGYQGGTYRYATAGSAVTASATWTPAFVSAGVYGVYVWYVPGANRVADAHYRVTHAGGVTDVALSQEQHGSTWHYLGSFYFQPGLGQGATLVNAAGQSGDVVIADAVRFGGGMGTIDPGPGLSGAPRWEEGALYFAQYQGMDVTGLNDVTARPRYAEWEHVAGDDPIYLSWHTNGGNATTRGTESYIHDTNPTPGSAALQSWVHSELVNDLRAVWDPGWVDRGPRAMDLGEVRELSTMPGVLVEIAFHDEPTDAAALRDPVFEQIAARALAQGVVKYYAARDGAPVLLAPEPPTHLIVRSLGGGQVQIDWRAPVFGDALGDAAQSYRVYVSANGRGWDEGVAASGTRYTLSGLAEGQTVFVRVTAVNAGGESFPTPVLAARHFYVTRANALVVQGFDMLAQELLIDAVDPCSPAGACPNVRMALDQMNRYNYLIEHAEAFPAGFSFDSAMRDAVVDGDVRLLDYGVVDWLGGVDWIKRGQWGIGGTAQAKLSEYLGAGRGLLISGSEIAWDLVHNGQGAAFYQNWLHADYVADDAQTYALTADGGGLFAGLGPFTLDDGTQGTYNVRWPDVLTPNAGGNTALAYNGGLGGAAGVQYGGSYRVIVLGFPLEALYPRTARAELVSRAVNWLYNQTPRLYLPAVFR